jgi:uncharacterized protein
MSKPRGFAAMDRQRVREIASKGGEAAHKAGTAHQFTSEEARVAGKKGGRAPHKRRGPTPKSDLDTTRGTDVTPQYEGSDGAMSDDQW